MLAIAFTPPPAAADCLLPLFFLLLLLQYVTIRNGRGREMWGLVRDRVEEVPTASSGDRAPVVMSTVEADDVAKFGKARTCCRLPCSFRFPPAFAPAVRCGAARCVLFPKGQGLLGRSGSDPPHAWRHFLCRARSPCPAGWARSWRPC